MSARTLRARDLQDLTPQQFEQLTFLLARAEEPEAVIVRNQDRGLDARLPDLMGRLTLRGWQAKRFATGEVQWSQCEESVRTALAFWRPLWIVFVFAHDLSATEQAAFKARLIDAFPIVRLTFWSAEEVLRRMRDTDDGRRATTWLYDRPGTLDELMASLIDKEPVVGAQAIAERQAALNQQFDNDPHLYYTAVVRPAGAPPTPPAPEAVASVILMMDGQEVRYDLSERYPGSLGDLGGGPALIARDDDEGRTAREALEAAIGGANELTIEDGLGVVWPSVPVGLRGLMPEEPAWGAVHVGEQVDAPEVELPPMPMLVVSGDAQIGVAFVHAADLDEGWDATLIGATGGLELTQSFRLSDDGIEAVQTRWRHTLGVGTATEQLLGARVLLSALEGQEIVLQVPGQDGQAGQATLTLEEHDFDADAVEQLRTHATFLEYTCEVQAWLGTPLFPPARPTTRDVSELGRALGLIREPVHTGTWTAIEIVEHEGADPPQDADVAILQPVHVELFGTEHYLGMQLLQVQQAVIERSGDGTRLRPGVSDIVAVQLHHPDQVPAEAASRFVGPSRGRVLMRVSTDDEAAAVEDSVQRR